MSERGNRPSGAAGGDAEAFLERWSRRKSEARSAAGDAPGEEAGPDGAGDAPDGPRAADPVAPASTEASLPDLDTLGEDSDYSAFLSPGVDAALRRKALRKLFQSPKFNILDGLDDYMGDYTTFEPLGSLVTADMRYQLERAAKRLADALDQPEAPDTAATAPPAAEPAVGEGKEADTGATADDGKNGVA